VIASGQEAIEHLRLLRDARAAPPGPAPFRPRSYTQALARARASHGFRTVNLRLTVISCPTTDYRPENLQQSCDIVCASM